LAAQRILNPKAPGSSPGRPTPLFSHLIAGVAKLEDAQGLGPCGSDPVEVQVLSPALPVMIREPLLKVR
jgi:hypothetical protein